MVWYYDVVVRLQEIGLLDVILPFMLIFVVVFAILQKSTILGVPAKAKKFNLVVAMVMGLLVVLPHVLYGSGPNSAELSISVSGKPLPDVVNIINNALPTISIWIIAILMVMLLIGMFGSKVKLSDSSKGWVLLAAVLIVFYVFAVSADWFNTPSWLGWLNDTTNQAVLLVLLVFGIIIAYVAGGETPRGKGFFGQLGEMVKSERER